MTADILIVLGMVFVAVVLFATEKLRVDLVALIIMATLLLSRIVTPEEGLLGFSNTATVTVAAMFILSGALFKSGAVNFFGELLRRAFRLNFWVALVALMVVAAALSAFINNTPVVAIFIPLVVGAAAKLKVSASRLLMPLSFASMFGGVCTLIGTSTNILVSSIAERHGLPAFTMFEFAPLGLVFFALGTVYMLVVGVRLIPERRAEEDLTQRYGLGDYLTEIVLGEKAKSVGTALGESPLVKEVGVDVLELRRGERRIVFPSARTKLEAGDVLRVRCDVKELKELREREGIELKPGLEWRDKDLESEEVALVEAVVEPNSELVGKTLRQVRFRQRFVATALAIRHHGRLQREDTENARLQAGDALLLEVHRDHLADLQESPAFLLVSEVGLPQFRRKKILPAVAILAGVVAVAALGWMPIVVTAIAGAVLIVLTRCISLEEAYQSIDWKVIFLLAGVLTLGIALESTGAAEVISDLMVATLGRLGPMALVSGFYLLSTVLTNVMSNNATAALLAPVAIAAAETLGVDPKPLLMAVTFAASSSFMTPVGYQTNAMIYGPGQYKFTDFLRVGGPLNLIFWIAATILIPYFWPF
jgi:di/tricarboxylate transporter